MPQPVRAADLGLALLALLVGAGAVAVVTDGPQVSVAASVRPNAATPTPSVTLPPSQPVLEKATVLLVGDGLASAAEALDALGWSTLNLDQPAGALLPEEPFAGLADAPAAVLLEVPPGARTSTRVEEAVALVRDSYPDALVLVTGPFDATGTKTEAAAESAAEELDVLYVDPVAGGWLALEPAALARELDARLTASVG